MKIIYSELKKLLPDLSTDAKQIRDDLTLIGHFVSGFEEIEGEQVLDLEIRQNRADCLGYYGVARDLSVFYNIKIQPPFSREVPPSLTRGGVGFDLPIKINSSDVKRLMSVKISNIKVQESPDWLKKFLKLHDINSINNIVDITNYIMLLYGIPCHSFDTKKTTDNLIWENNNGKYKTFTTLDGTSLELNPEILIISNQKEALSLGFIGGQNSGIDLNTTETIIEMAIYNPSRIRQDSRSLKTITEASIRLDKFLDTELIPQGFNHLAQLIIEMSGGQISSEIYDNYFEKPVLNPIEFNPKKPSIYAGIDIPTDFAIDCLTRLGCQFSSTIDDLTSTMLITPPSIRKDISLEEDLIEEVIRFWGYNKIPLDQPISKEPLPDITPPVLYLIEKLKDELMKLGYDEIRSWPLTQKPIDQKTAIYTQNSINSEYPVLRQSIIQSLEKQLGQYIRFKLPLTQFFEIGKIFNQKNNKYTEQYSLGIYNHNCIKLKQDIDTLNLSNHTKLDGGDTFAEIILDDIVGTHYNAYLPKNIDNTAYELTSQIITLDANITLDKEEKPIDLINKYSQIIGDKYLWQLIITDIYHDEKLNKYRYTFRASYFNTDDKTAKTLHLKSFGLETFTSP